MVLTTKRLFDEWVEELKYGSYLKGTRYLKQKDHNGLIYHDALGVLVEVYSKYFPIEWAEFKSPIDKVQFYAIKGQPCVGYYLPDSIVRFMRFKTKYATISQPLFNCNTIAGLNDVGYPFTAIAALLEYYGIEYLQ